MDGHSPIFTVNGHLFNVRIEWPSEYDCAINGPIEVQVKVPRDAEVRFISESVGDLECESPVQTSTAMEFEKKANRHVKVKARVPADASFPVLVKVDVNGQHVRTYEGQSNGQVTGQPIKLSKDGSEI